MVTRAASPIVVIVAYHNTEDLRAALGGLGQGIEAVVVDNGVDAEVESLCRSVGARYVSPGSNVGFAAAVNLGLRAARADGPRDVLLLNPDARISSDDVGRLSRFTHA